MALTGGRFMVTVATPPSRWTLTYRSLSPIQKVKRSMPPATLITWPVT